MFVRMFAMRLKARAVTTKIDTNSHKSAVDHRARETSSLSYQKALRFQRHGDDTERHPDDTERQGDDTERHGDDTERHGDDSPLI